MSNDFLKDLLALHPDLADEYNSEQYQKSLEIINLMTEHGINSKKMAKIIGCSHKIYIRLESGDTTIPVTEYENAITKIKMFFEQLAAYEEFSFNSSKVLTVSTLKDTDIMETVKHYSNIKHIQSTESHPHLLKSYLDHSIEHFYKTVNQILGFKPTHKYPDESSSSYYDFTYQS